MCDLSRPSGGVDLLARLACRDLDLARLRLLGDRDPQGQDSGLIGRGQVVRVERLPKEQLAAENAVTALVDDPLSAVGLWGLALGMDGHHVLLDREIDRVRADAWKIQVDYEMTVLAVSRHRHHRWTCAG